MYASMYSNIDTWIQRYMIMYIFIQRYLNIYILVHTYIYICICTHVHKYIYIRIEVYAYRAVPTYTLYTFMYRHEYTCQNMCINDVSKYVYK